MKPTSLQQYNTAKDKKLVKKNNVARHVATVAIVIITTLNVLLQQYYTATVLQNFKSSYIATVRHIL